MMSLHVMSFTRLFPTYYIAYSFVCLHCTCRSLSPVDSAHLSPRSMQLCCMGSFSACRSRQCSVCIMVSKNVFIWPMFNLQPCSRALPQHIWGGAWESGKLVKHFSVSTVGNGYIILLFKTSIHVYVKAYIHWFYIAYLPHLASPPESI